MEKDPKLGAGSGEPDQGGTWEKISPEASVANTDSAEASGSDFEPTEFRKELKDLRDSVDRLNAGFNSLRRRFLVGIVTGLGTVIGATIVVSLLVFLLKPLGNIEFLRPGIESIIEMMDEERDRQEAEEEAVEEAQDGPPQKTGDDADLPRSEALPEVMTPVPEADPVVEQ